MKNEDKVAILQQSKRLKELGVVLKTERYWEEITKNHPVHWVAGTTQLNTYKGVNSSYINYTPAPDVAELGELLPYPFKIDGKDAFWVSSRGNGLSSVSFLESTEKITVLAPFDYPTEAQARCNALIWLIENKHIDVKKINQGQI